MAASVLNEGTSEGIELIRTLFAIAILFAGLAAEARAQSNGAGAQDAAGVNRDALLNAFDAEAKRGTVLNYEQYYRSEGKVVLIKGTLYTGITKFEANKCGLSIATTIADRFVGRMHNEAIKETQNTYYSAGEIPLTPEIANGVHVVTARPSQLARGTHPACKENEQCLIYWLQFRAKDKVMKLTSSNNDVAGFDGFVRDFDGMVAELWLPISSQQAGTELTALLKSFAATCSK